MNWNNRISRDMGWKSSKFLHERPRKGNMMWKENNVNHCAVLARDDV